MNDRLEAFRKRLRGPDREKTNWQLWIGSPVAWLALIISCTTAFFSLIYYSDELRVAVAPGTLRLHGDNAYMVSAPVSFTFINSGTRPVAVLGITLNYVQPSTKTGDPVCDGTGNVGYLPLTIEATVVKPHDTVVVMSSKNPGRDPPGEAELSRARVLICRLL